MQIYDIQKENITGLENGLHNLYRHINNIKNQFGLNAIVAINRYETDTNDELNYLENKLKENGIQYSLVEGWKKGGEGAIDIANKLVEITNKKDDFRYIYKNEDSIETKIEEVSRKIYGAKNVEYTEEAIKEIKQIEELGYGKLPICIAKTQYSFSDDSKNLECKNEYNIHVRNVEVKAGAGFIVVFAGKIMTMPGLPKIPSAEKIDIDENGNVIGIF